MRYVFTLISEIISLITILFAAYALISMLRGIVRRDFNLKNVIVSCLYYFCWLITLILTFALVAGGVLFAGSYVLEIFSVSNTSIVWGAWIAGLFLISMFLAAGVTAFLWKSYGFDLKNG